jgi:hypothetical protein
LQYSIEFQLTGSTFRLICEIGNVVLILEHLIRKVTVEVHTTRWISLINVAFWSNREFFTSISCLSKSALSWGDVFNKIYAL